MTYRTPEEARKKDCVRPWVGLLLRAKDNEGDHRLGIVLTVEGASRLINDFRAKSPDAVFYSAPATGNCRADDCMGWVIDPTDWDIKDDDPARPRRGCCGLVRQPQATV